MREFIVQRFSAIAERDANDTVTKIPKAFSCLRLRFPPPELEAEYKRIRDRIYQISHTSYADKRGPSGSEIMRMLDDEAERNELVNVAVEMAKHFEPLKIKAPGHSMHKPATASDMVIYVNDVPIPLKELVAWKPDILDMGMVEAVEHIAQFMGLSDKPLPLEQMHVDFFLELDPPADAPEYPAAVIVSECERDLVAAFEDTQRVDELDHLTASQYVDALHDTGAKLEQVRHDTIEARRNYSMIAKLSQNSDKKSK